MKTKGLTRPRVNIITMGCAKNLVDSEEILTQLKANRFDARHEDDQSAPQVVVINTCGFIESAKQQSIDTILNYAQAKSDGLVESICNRLSVA